MVVVYAHTCLMCDLGICRLTDLHLSLHLSLHLALLLYDLANAAANVI